MATIRIGGWMLCGLVIMATGCAQLKAPPYTADYPALDQLKASKPGPVAVNTVQPTDPNDALNNLSLRGTRLVSPSGTFAKYLESALINDLREVSAYDAASHTKIDARILGNDISVSNIITGTGTMEVRIEVRREDELRLRKNYKANISFESSFAGAVAIPAGQAAYPALTRALLQQVYSDPEFKVAISR